MYSLIIKYLVPLCLLAPVSLHAQSVTIRQNHDSAFSAAGVTVVPVDSGSLRVAGLDSASTGFFQTYPQLMPFHIVLTNNSGRTIHLATLRYAKRYRSDQKTIVYGTYQTFFSLSWKDSSGLKNGASVVLGPSGEVKRALAMRETLGNAGAALANTLQMDFSQQRYDEIGFSLDSVVLGDGQVVGPDVYDVVRQDTERNNAERMLLEGFISRLGQGKEPTKTWLRTIQNERWSVNASNGQPDFYRTAASGLALSLVTLLDTMPFENMAKYAQAMLTDRKNFVPIHH